MSEEETKVPVWWENVLFYTNMGFFLIVWYVIGCILSSFIIQEIVFSIVSILTSGLGMIYWKIECLFDFLYRTLWLLSSFGLQVWLLSYMLNFIVNFVQSMLDISKKTSNEVRMEFKSILGLRDNCIMFFIIFLVIIGFIADFFIGVQFFGIMVMLIIFLSQFIIEPELIDLSSNKPNQDESETNKFLSEHIGKYHLYDPINVTPINAQFTILKQKFDEVKESRFIELFKEYSTILMIGLFILSRFFRDGSLFNILSYAPFLLLNLLTLRLNQTINILSCAKYVFRKRKQYLSRISDDIKNKVLTIDYIIIFLITVYIISFVLVFILLFVWGILWTSPYKPIKNEKLYYSNSNLTIKAKSHDSTFCQLKANNLDIIQLSGLPTLMYTFNRGINYNESISKIQKHNQKILLQYLFGDLSRSIYFNMSTITPWSVQVVIPQINKSHGSDIVVQIYGGYRTPFDWALFSEIFVIKYMTFVFNAAIMFFNIFETIFGFTYKFFIFFWKIVFNVGTYSEYVMSVLETQYSNSMKANFIVGQGIGGFFAKSIWTKLDRNSKEIVFAFESNQLVELSYDWFLNYQKSKTLVNNIYSNTIFSNFEPAFDHNFKRKGRSSNIKADEAFTTFCSTVAFCAKSTLYDPLCNELGKDYDDQIYEAQRVYYI